MEQKAEFVKELMDNVRDTLLANIKRTPEDWDGHELRQWIADKCADNVSPVMRDRRSSRRKAFDNTVIVDNL